MNGLNQMGVKARILSTPQSFRVTVAAYRNQLRPGAPGQSPNLTRRLVTVVTRQPDVEQHDLRSKFYKNAQRGFHLSRAADFITFQLQ